MSKTHVLVVDDEELYRRALERILGRAGHQVITARDGAEALSMLASHPIDLVLCDVKMPGISGIELVRQIHDLQPDLPSIVVTGYGSAENSVEALRAGAFWYLEKPFDQGHLDVVRRLVDQAIEHGRLRTENRRLQHQLEERHQFDNIIGDSSSIRRVLETVAKVADTESTVLITGESGTGKELIARALHYNSRRSNRMMVTVNCGAIPEELLESELFGHVQGAFTNAVRQRQGRFALADGGTIFLDEIGDMSPTLQVKLLRVLQNRSFEPVGSSKTVEVDVRVVAATNQNLVKLMAEGGFREDLYYRLNVLPIEAPPLRERREDIPLLVRHFFDRTSQEKDIPIESISDEALQQLVAYDWPGNVRELENLVERMILLGSSDEIGTEDLPTAVREARFPTDATPIVPAAGLAFNDVVAAFETDLIEQALSHTDWNKNRAAKLLSLNRTTLVEKIRKRGIVRPVTES